MHQNIAAYLPEMAERNPYQRAIIISEGRDQEGRMMHRHMTYGDLDSQSSAIARGLLESNFKKGQRVALMIPPSFELFITAFGLFKAGLVPVFVDPGLGIRSLKVCLNRARLDHFIGIPKAQLARSILGWNRGSWKEIVTVGGPKLWGRHSFRSLLDKGLKSELELKFGSPEDAAAILFTSGSTGSPKGALYSHKNFCAQVESLKQQFNIEVGEVDLCTFPLFALFAPAMGMTAVIPEMDFTRPAQVNPDNIFKAIETFGVENMFGSPALIKRVAEAAAIEGRKLHTLKRVISAGAPVSAQVIATLSTTLKKGTKVYTPYGATEALPVAVAHSEMILNETESLTKKGAGVCIGKPVPGLEVHIIKVSDDPIGTWSDSLRLPQGIVGEIVVSGPQVTKSYFNQSDATHKAKIYSEDSRKVYHRMGDLAYFDTEGRLWFCGRKSHRVISSDKTLYTVPGESIVNAHREIEKSAIVGVGSGKNRRPVLCLQSPGVKSAKDRKKLSDEVKELCSKHPQTHGIEDILFHKEFPVDIRHNSKIFREKLSTWAEGQLS